ncbi:hypothetical protein JZ751_003087 [Albula glossodonta]|uniref:Cornichon family AMPA receptor auxiliary protein 1 n=1 Tax=Albula glossodonta TaxID=121402 RepID=A0A8T2N8S5_9TELE|nr:hypothetical protein JZ751_003087 [Albula glossodonta]
MAFTFAAFCYMLALLLTAALIFFAIWHIIAFDELKTDYKNPIDQCNTLNPVRYCSYSLVSLFLSMLICCFFLISVFLLSFYPPFRCITDFCTVKFDILTVINLL